MTVKVPASGTTLAATGPNQALYYWGALDETWTNLGGQLIGAPVVV